MKRLRLEKLQRNETIIKKAAEKGIRYKDLDLQLVQAATHRKEYDRAISLMEDMIGEHEMSLPEKAGMYNEISKIFLLKNSLIETDFHHRQAYSYLEKSMQIYPEQSDCYYLMSKLYMQKQQYQEAAQTAIMAYENMLKYSGRGLNVN